MRRVLALLLTLMLAAALFAGCNKDKQTDGDSKSPTGAADPSKDPALQEEVELTYASWGDAEIEQKMIEEFTALYPNIKITKDENLTSNGGNWNESLSALAASGNLPDVFWIENTTVPLSNKWLADLTPYIDADPESKTIIPSLLEMGKYNGKVMVLPRGMFLEGVLMNMDFLDQKNIPYPKYNWSTKDFSDILTKCKSKNTIGVLNVNLLRETLPAQFNPNLGWATYNSGKYSFSTGEWVEAVNYVKEIDSKQLTFESFPSEDRKGKFTTDDSLVAFSEGKLAMIMDGTWQLNAIADGKVNFKYDFYPLPTKEGNEYSRPAMVSDYLGVSSESANKRAAFEFAKWMSYSAKGYEKKLEIASKGEELFGKKKVVLELPVTSSTESRDKWMKYNNYDIGGIKDMFKNIDKAFVDPMKTVPGYPKSYFDTVASQYVKIEAGEFSASDKANEFNQKANQYYNEALQAVNN